MSDRRVRFVQGRPLLLPPARHVGSMRQAGQRDEVVAILLDAVHPLAEQVGLFVIQQKQFACLDGRGPSHVIDMLKWSFLAGQTQRGQRAAQEGLRDGGLLPCLHLFGFVFIQPEIPSSRRCCHTA